MKLVIVSLAFLPKTGGLENIISGLAQEWHGQGHQVTVFTDTKEGPDSYGYRVIRKFSLVELIKAIGGADVFFEANISLKTCFAGLMYKKKWFVTHQIIYDYKSSWKERLKYYLTSFSINIAASKYVSDNIKGTSTIIPNAYNPLFRRLSSIQKDKDIVFVGRLVSDKGVDDLINALSIVKKNGRIFQCTIIGEGPERRKLEELATEKKLQREVSFNGVMKGEELVAEINRHKIMAVPSRWNEPFGIVALEGLACGCRIICSSGGGLPEAAGSTAALFANADVFAMATAITETLELGSLSETEQKKIADHLYLHSLGQIAKKYMKVFNDRA